MGYYGTTVDDTLVTEENSPGDDFLAKVCFDWEMSTAPAARLGVRRAVIRTGVVLSNEGGAFPKMRLPFKFYAGGKLGSGTQWLPWIHSVDEVRAIRFLLENSAAEGAFNLAAPNPVTNEAFSLKLSEIMGRPAYMPAPAPLVRAALGEMATMLVDGQRAVPARLEQMGFTFEFPTIESALKDLAGDRTAAATPIST